MMAGTLCNVSTIAHLYTLTRSTSIPIPPTQHVIKASREVTIELSSPLCDPIDIGLPNIEFLGFGVYTRVLWDSISLSIAFTLTNEAILTLLYLICHEIQAACTHTFCSSNDNFTLGSLM